MSQGRRINSAKAENALVQGDRVFYRGTSRVELLPVIRSWLAGSAASKKECHAPQTSMPNRPSIGLSSNARSRVIGAANGTPSVGFRPFAAVRRRIHW
jgi:hypothetical protein